MSTPDSDEFFVSPEEFDDNVRDEKGIIPRFFVEPARMAAKSEEAGYDVFEDVEFIEINRAGDRLNCWVGKVAKEHVERFPKAYRRFKAGMSLAKVGVPLEEWPLITRSMVMQWKGIGLESVEDVAGVDDGLLPKLGIDGLGWRAKANAWLKQRKDAGAAAKVASDSTKKDAEIARLNKSLKELSDRFDEMTAEDPSMQKRRTMTLQRPALAE